MGILDHLWDDTVAGPRPDSGLGKLRKTAAFSFRSSSGDAKESDKAMSNRRSFEEETAEDAVRVSRSIMIVKPPQGSQRDSPPASPAGSTPPASPFADQPVYGLDGAGAIQSLSGERGGGKEAFRFRRRSASFAYEKAQRSRSPPSAYDV